MFLPLAACLLGAVGPVRATEGGGDRLWAKGLSAPIASQRIDRDTFADLARAASPAVVNIFTTEAVRRRGLPLVPFSPLIPGLSYSAGNRTSLGTGFVIHADGYLLTNRHVIGTGTDIRAHFRNGDTYPVARVEMVASRLDIVLLKIEGTGLPVLPFADSDELRVGDWAMAIGNAFGLGHTVTTGTISNLIQVTGVETGGAATHRLEIIQTDASINPGNSGGPLLNLDGHVIGINTAVLRGGEHVGFALAINTVKSQLPTLKQLSLKPTVTIGATFVLLTAEEAEATYADRALSGSLKVVQVTPRSPARRARLRKGDVLLEVDGERIHTFDALQALLAQAEPGRRMTWRVRRGKRTLDLHVVGETPEN